MVVGTGWELFQMKLQQNCRHQSKINQVEKLSEQHKIIHKWRIFFFEMLIICWLSSLWCHSHLARTKLTPSHQTCTDWFQLFLWKVYTRPATEQNHPAQTLRPNGRTYSYLYLTEVTVLWFDPLLIVSQHIVRFWFSVHCQQTITWSADINAFSHFPLYIP